MLKEMLTQQGSIQLWIARQKLSSIERDDRYGGDAESAWILIVKAVWMADNRT
jgi:hypothetical protein